MKIYIYALPIVGGGQQITVPLTGPHTSVYADYLLEKVDSTLQFLPSQDTIIINSSIGAGMLLAATYIVIEREFDIPRGFFVNDVVSLACPNRIGNAYNFTIREDPWFMIANVARENIREIAGGLLLNASSSDELLFPSVYARARVPISPNYDPDIGASNIYFERLDDPGNYGENWTAIVCASTEKGMLITFAVDDRGIVGDKILTKEQRYSALLRQIANVEAVGLASYIVDADGKTLSVTTGPKINVSVNKMYLVPKEWAMTFAKNIDLISSGSRAYYHAYPDDNQKDMHIVQLSDGAGNGPRKVAQFEYDGKNIPEISKIYFCTPERAIDVGAGMLYRSPMSDYALNIPIYMGIGTATDTAAGNVVTNTTLYATSCGSDSVEIYTIINGAVIDLSEDFTFDFAVADAAVRQIQHKTNVVLQGITGAIGGISGVIGGINSGNLFGAVTSAAGGAQSLSRLAEARHEVATVRKGGSAWVGALTTSLLYIVAIGARNIDMIKAAAQHMGYAPEIPINMAFSRILQAAKDNGNVYVKGDAINISVRYLPKNMRDQIAADLAAGIELKAL